MQSTPKPAASWLIAIGAKRLHTPCFHMEACNRCNVDVTSDVNPCHTECVRRYLNDDLTKGAPLRHQQPMAVELHRSGDYGTPVPDYGEENVSAKVVKIIQSCTGVVNRMVWRKF